MPKVKPEYRLSDEESPPTPPIQELVARELAERAVTEPLPEPYPGDVIERWIAQEPVAPPVAVTFDPGLTPPSEPDVAEAKRRIDAIFASALGKALALGVVVPTPPQLQLSKTALEPPPGAPFGGGDDATSRLRREVLTELVQEGWKHSDAVTVANRVKAMLDADENLTVAIAKEDALYEFQSAKPPKAKPDPFVADDPSDPTDPADPTSVGTGLTGHGEPNDELLQIVHNLERDATRLRKLFGLEGVKKTRKGKVDG